MPEVPVRLDQVTLPGERGFRRDIEGLRGIAVLLVVLYHAGVPGLKGGFTGVDVFFVLSGYLITDLLVREVERTGTISLTHFYARRARRLLPAAVLTLVATLIAGAIAFSPLEQERYGFSALATALYVSNLYFLHEAVNYFGVAIASDPFLHTWSLAVEEQFYLVWPVLIAAGFAGRRDRRRLLALLGLVCVVSFVACVWLTWTQKPWAFFASPLRAWEFGVGGLASLAPVAVLRARVGWWRGLGWTGLLAILAAGYALRGSWLFPGPWALVPVLGTVAALVAGACEPDRGIGRVLATPSLQFMGRLSYSWYLWHWPVLLMATQLHPSIPLEGRLLCAAGALALAWVTHRTVENPVRFHPRLVARPRLSLQLAGALSAVGLAVTLGAYVDARRTAAVRPHKLFSDAAADRSDLYRTRCLSAFGVVRRRECVFGDSTSSTVVVLLGDSHAAHWFPALQRMAEERHWRLVAMVRAGCPAATIPVFDPAVGRATETCKAWREESMARITAMRPSAVVLANSVGYVARAGKRLGYYAVPTGAWEAGNRRTFQLLDSAGVRTILLRDSPRPEFDVPVCLARAARRGHTEERCNLARGHVVDPDVFGAERRAARDLPHVSVVDFTDLFCGPSECPAVRDGMVVYSDDNHLTATYSRSIAPAMYERLAPIVRAGAAPLTRAVSTVRR